jgi:hypothetical protein
VTALETVLALEDIKRLKARRIRAMDEKDWQTYEALHAPGHVSDTYGGSPSIGARENGERLSRLLAGVTSIHHAFLPEISFVSDVEARGVWAMEDRLFWKQGEEDHWLHGFGHYHERYEKRERGWLFTYRRLTRLKVMTSPGAKLGDLNVSTRLVPSDTP